MKHLLLFLLLITGLVLTARAQSANPLVWCPSGATWTYGWRLFSAYGTLTVRYARDTVVAGQPAQVLTRQLAELDFQNPGAPTTLSRLPSLLTRTVGERVEVQANGQFYTLYDFAALPGTSWLTPCVQPRGPCPAELVRVTVDSVGTQPLAGRSFRWLRVHLTTPVGAAVAGSWGGRCYEQIGDLLYLQPQSPTCGISDPGNLGPLTGFYATGSSAIAYGPTGTLVLASAWARAAAVGFGVYPNPGAEVVHLQLPTGLGPGTVLRLLDLTGRVIRQLPIPTSGQLDTRGLPTGAYTLLLLAPGQAPVGQQLLVE